MMKLFEYRTIVCKAGIGIMLAIAAVCASCRPEEVETTGAKEGLPAIIQLNVQAGEQPDIQTRAVDADKINDVHVLIYNSTGELIGQKYENPLSGAITVNTKSANGCTIYVVANTGDANLFASYGNHSEQSLTDKIYTVTTWNALTNRNDLPMTGKKENVNIAAGNQSLSGNLEVTRMAAKVNLKIGVAAHSNITITDYTIYSLPLQSYYILRPLSTEVSVTDGNTTQGDDAATDNTHWINGAKVAVNATSASAEFYMFENRRGVVSSITNQKDKSTAKAPAHATYVEINGKVGSVTATWKVYLGANNTSNFNIKRNCSYTYNITLNDAVTADTRVDLDLTKVADLSTAATANCYIASQTGTWYKFKATVRGNGAATEALISPTGTALAANAPIAPTSAELVWEGGQNIKAKDLIQAVLFRDGYIYFKTGNKAEGNAVIAAKDAAGTVLWSWHIWKTSFDLAGLSIDHTQTYKTRLRKGMNSNYWNDFTTLSRELKMMDRDLGAASNKPSNTDEVTKTFGLYYQFGRKDPFPMAKNRERRQDNNSEIVDVFDKDGKKLTAATLKGNAYQVKNSTASTNAKGIITYAINNPLTFILHDETDKSGNGGDGSNPSYNWIYGAHPANFTASKEPTNAWRISNRLWGGQFTDDKTSLRLDTKFTGKTIYDPCPVGWCMPPQDTWTNFTTTNTGESTAITDYNTINTAYYNCPAADKKNYEDGDGKGFMLATSGVFGRRFYVSGVGKGAEAFYPAAGFRNGDNGKVYSVGCGCYAWSSAPFQANSQCGSYFYTYVGWVYPVDNPNRSRAFPVRCVQETSVK